MMQRLRLIMCSAIVTLNAMSGCSLFPGRQAGELPAPASHVTTASALRTWPARAPEGDVSTSSPPGISVIAPSAIVPRQHAPEPETEER